MRLVRSKNVVLPLAAAVGGLLWASTALAAPDSWITAKTKIALLTTPGVSSSAVSVDTVDGRVTLYGKVSSAEAKAKAEAEARKISGVRDVRNLLQVVPEQQEKYVKAADSEVKDRVEKALRDDRALRDSDIKVASVDDGVTLLKGKAATVSDHLRAIEDAASVPGVRRVASEIVSPDRLADREVRRRTEQPEAGTSHGFSDTASDAWITTDAKLRLLADSRTPALDINVDTRDGVVTLFGIVDSEDSKRAAEADIRKISGVKRVANQLQIVPRARQEQVKARDEDLTRDVKRSIEARQDLRDADINVDVKAGVARLTGSVANDGERLAAAIAARSIPGVRAVQDDLQVKTARAGE